MTDTLTDLGFTRPAWTARAACPGIDAAGVAA